MKRVIVIILILITAYCRVTVGYGNIAGSGRVFEKNRYTYNQGWRSLQDYEMCALVILSYLKTNEYLVKKEMVPVYENVIRSYEKEYEGLKYGLIYVTEDDIPELLVNLQDYWISLYTCVDGKLYTIMRQAAYGTWGRTYTYCEKEGIINSSVYSFEDGILVNHEEHYRINEDYELEEIDI